MSRKRTAVHPFRVKNGVLQRNSSGKDKRVTLVLSEALDLNLELYAMSCGKLKKDVVSEALTKFLKDEGIPDPSIAPEISWEQRPGS